MRPLFGDQKLCPSYAECSVVVKVYVNKNAEQCYVMRSEVHIQIEIEEELIIDCRTGWKSGDDMKVRNHMESHPPSTQRPRFRHRAGDVPCRILEEVREGTSEASLIVHQEEKDLITRLGDGKIMQLIDFQH